MFVTLKSLGFENGDEAKIEWHFSLRFSKENNGTFIHMKPTGTPSSPALENIAFPISLVICKDQQKAKNS